MIPAEIRFEIDMLALRLENKQSRGNIGEADTKDCDHVLLVCYEVWSALCDEYTGEPRVS